MTYTESISILNDDSYWQNNDFYILQQPFSDNDRKTPSISCNNHFQIMTEKTPSATTIFRQRHNVCNNHFLSMTQENAFYICNNDFHTLMTGRKMPSLSVTTIWKWQENVFYMYNNNFQAMTDRKIPSISTATFFQTMRDRRMPSISITAIFRQWQSTSKNVISN